MVIVIQNLVLYDKNKKYSLNIVSFINKKLSYRPGDFLEFRMYASCRCVYFKKKAAQAGRLLIDYVGIPLISGVLHSCFLVSGKRSSVLLGDVVEEVLRDGTEIMLFLVEVPSVGRSVGLLIHTVASVSEDVGRFLAPTLVVEEKTVLKGPCADKVIIALVLTVHFT